MSAWAKANGVKNDDIIFASDVGLNFSQRLGWTNNERAARYALIINDGKIVYAERDTKPGVVSVSGAEAVLAKL